MRERREREKKGGKERGREGGGRREEGGRRKEGGRREGR
jgi:hypothetical protein